MAQFTTDNADDYETGKFVSVQGRSELIVSWYNRDLVFRVVTIERKEDDYGYVWFHRRTYVQTEKGSQEFDLLSEGSLADELPHD